MSAPEWGRRGVWVRLIVVVVLTAGYAALAVYMNLKHHTDVVHTHLAYVPIVLAGVWWGRRGVVVAVVLAAMTLLLHVGGLAAGLFWHDLVRAGALVAAGLCSGVLADQVLAVRCAERATEARNRLIVEKSLAGILLYRFDDYRAVFANSRMGRMLGYRPEAMVGMEVWDFIAEDDQPRVRELVAKRKAEGFTDLHYECRLVRSDGSALWADMLSSVGEHGGERAVLVNAYDVTARREAEATRRELAELSRTQEEELVHSTRLAELGEMAAAVAHDLNQPLTGVRNFARNALYMMEEGVGGEEDVKDNLRLITEQVDRASRIINQMRALTRKSEPRLSALDLNAVIRESVEFLTPQLRLSGVETELDLGGTLPPILGDRTRFEQVLLNLLTNARQAMEETGERRLRVCTRFEGGSERPVVVEIADTGKGFPQDEAARLFAPFFSTKKRGHGTGLGLTISQRIINDHGGIIQAEGEAGKGATFTLRFPVPRPESLREATA